MAFPGQLTVDYAYAEGIEGSYANINPAVYTVLNGVTGAEVALASFVWRDGDENWVNTGTGQPEGFVQRVQDYYIWDLSEESVFTAKTGARLTVMRRGDIWAKLADNATAPVAGQAVFANTTNGTLSTAASGSTVASAVETPWKVYYVSPDSNNLFIMTNWDAQDLASLTARVTALESA